MRFRVAQTGFILAACLSIGAALILPQTSISSAAVQAEPDLKLLKLIKIPQVTQHTPFHCGAAAMQSVLSYYGIEYYQEDLGKKLGTSPEDGTPVNNMVSFARAEGFDARLHHGMTRDSLQGILDARHPVIVVIQAWAASADSEGSKAGKVDWKNMWDSGHYVVAIGYDADRVYFMDPLLVSSYAWIPWEEFLDRWHDQGKDGVIVRGGIEMIPDATMKFPPPDFVRMN